MSTCSLFHVGALCSDPGTLVLFQAQFWFRVGVRRLTLQVWSCCGSMRSRVRSGRALLCPCAFVVFVLLSQFFSCFVWHAACVFHWLRAFMFVMFCVNTQLMSLLISCVASDSVLLPCACVFVLCEHMAFVIVSVCLVLMSIVLTPPILFPDYWFICPTCVVLLPSSFAPFIISLCLQSRASSSSNVVCACLVRLFNFCIQ